MKKSLYYNIKMVIFSNMISFILAGTSLAIGKEEKNIKENILFKGQNSMLSQIKDKNDVQKLFPKTASQINDLTKKFISDAQVQIDNIIKIEPEKRNLENTAKAIDNLMAKSDLKIFSHCVHTLEMVSPDKEIRDTAHEKIIEINNFSVENINNNMDLGKAILDYYENNFSKEIFTNIEEKSEFEFFIKETIKKYERAGLRLPQEKREEVKQINKDLLELELTYETNIAQENKKLEFEEKELEGLDSDFIKYLREKSLENGAKNILVGLDTPTVSNIMNNCKIEETRKKIYLDFNNRAYPINEKVLEEIRIKRDRLAKLLGFGSYADFDLDDQMAKKPETVKNFLESVFKKSDKKANLELEQLKQNLPENVTLSEDNKIKAWDLKYIINNYKKIHFNIDEQEIAKYFPANKTIDALLKIYEQFFEIEFRQANIDLWHSDVKFYEVYEKNGSLLGLLFMDLYPRENKYGHACQTTTVPGVKGFGPCVAGIITNFPKELPGKPALMELDNVRTFFHELGHALHAIFGRTISATLSGNEVKSDFVEMPSQMFEQWLNDKDILKNISCQYQTGKQLEDKIIEKIIESKTFDSGLFLSKQGVYSMFSLNYFGPDLNIHPKEMLLDINKKMFNYFYSGPETHMYASFGHLASQLYGAKYYSYMWSKVFTCDIFCEIKKHGLLNPEIGKKFKDMVLAKGASQDPNIMIKNFLSRDANDEAFFKEMGLI